MRISKKRSFVAFIATAAALTALGAGSGQALAASPTSKDKPAATHAVADPAFLAKERAAGRGVVSTDASRAALATIEARIRAYVAKNGTKYTFGTYSDPATGNVVIDTDAPDSLVASLTNSTSKLYSAASNRSLASAKVKIHKEKTKDAFQRRDDVPAFYGGGGLLASGFLCSTGYAVKDASGNQWMVTAGHCFANGTSVNTESNLRQVGIVTGRTLASLGGGPIDVEFLAGQPYAGRIFTGGVTSSTSIPVVSAGSAVVGYNNYCHSGRTTGEQCGHTATSVTAQVCTTTGCKSPVIAYTGGVVQQGGDSGGTFYAKDASGAWIRGHVIAGNSTTGYVEPYTQITARWAVTAVTG
jgi:hypothetical protein